MALETIRIALLVLLTLVGVAQVTTRLQEGAGRRETAIWGLWTAGVLLLTAEEALRLSMRIGAFVLGTALLVLVAGSALSVREHVLGG